MLVRYSIKCNTCEKITTLRIQLIHSECEEIKFLCPYCKENISVEMKTDYKNITFSITPKKNCKKSDLEGETLYLGSEVITTNTATKDSMSMPAPEFMHQINEGSTFRYFLKEKNTSNWSLLHRAFSQKQQKKYDLLEKLLKEYCESKEISKKYMKMYMKREKGQQKLYVLGEKGREL